MMRLVKRVQTAMIAALLAACTSAILADSGTSAGDVSQAGQPPARIVACRVGFRDSYKVGYWTPIWVDVRDGAKLSPSQLEVTVRDSDGVPATVSADVLATDDSISTTLLYAKFGRLNSPVRVAMSRDGDMLDQVTFEPGVEAGEGRILPALRATSELVVGFGPSSLGLVEALGNRDADASEPARRVVHLDELAELPTKWYGYEAVDVLVLSTSDAELCRQLVADAARWAALRTWVELGGRLVLLCGRRAPELIADGGPLAALVPGRFMDMVPLPQTGPLEQFAGSVVSIVGRGSRVELSVPRLTGVVGRVEAFTGQRPADLPLVVRAPHGFGELVFAGVDLDEPPLDRWHGRGAFVRALVQLGGRSTQDSRTASQSLVTHGYNDLAGALRQRLGRSFHGVPTITFPIVALLAVGYLLLLGPLDYLFVHKLTRRAWLAWVTFPFIVLATSGGAYWIAQASKGARTHVNQAELVDVDLTTNVARGTYWATLYSPQPQRYDLSLAVRLPKSARPDQTQTLLSSLGMPGFGVGGMETPANDFDSAATEPYLFSAELDSLAGVPIHVGSTKSLMARWRSPVEQPVEAQLTLGEDGLLAGTITNRSGAAWNDAHLLFGAWAYRVGDVADGAPVEISEQLEPKRVTGLLARRTRGSSPSDPEEASRDVFDVDRASLDQLLHAMMFYEAAGGYGLIGLPNRYQAYCDFSGLLALGRAVLVVRYNGTGSELMDQRSGTPLRAEQDQRLVVYRYNLPVNEDVP